MINRREFLRNSALGMTTAASASGTGSRLVASGASADGVHFHQSGFGPNPEGWSAWSVRAETAPRTFVDPVVSCGGSGSLGVSGDGNIAAFGGWQRTLTGIKEGAWYRFVAHYRAVGVTSENWQIVPDLYWQKPDGSQIGNDDRVDYAARSVRKGQWTEVSLEVPAPAGATYVVLELFLAHAATGIVWWDDISFDEIPAPQPRKVTIATINLKPSNTGTVSGECTAVRRGGEAPGSRQHRPDCAAGGHQRGRHRPERPHLRAGCRTRARTDHRATRRAGPSQALLRCRRPL